MYAIGIFLVVLVVFVPVSSAYRLQYRSTRGFSLYAKTPLVANGKRVEAEAGSSMLAVRLMIRSL